MDPLFEPTLGGTGVEARASSERPFRSESIPVLAAVGGAFAAWLIVLVQLRRLPLLPEERKLARNRVAVALSTGVLAMVLVKVGGNRIQAAELGNDGLLMAWKVCDNIACYALFAWAVRSCLPAERRYLLQRGDAEGTEPYASMWILGLGAALLPLLILAGIGAAATWLWIHFGPP